MAAKPWKLEPFGFFGWGFWDPSIPGLFVTRKTKAKARKERDRRMVSYNRAMYRRLK